MPPARSILLFVPSQIGSQTDTLEIRSDDPAEPVMRLPVSAEVISYFHTIDNEDSDEYDEFGKWHTSVANIYGPTSRYAWLNDRPLASARFHTTLRKSGTYEILEIVPKTVNSTDDALYELRVDGARIASYHINQNQGSGNWVTVGTAFLPANKEIELWVKDTGNSTIGAVIRTDAVRFRLIDETTGIDGPEPARFAATFGLEQNYPNPFNPTTVIFYQLLAASQVELTVYSALGQKIATLVEGRQEAGYYTQLFDATGLASGIYYYKIRAGGFVQVRKMTLMK